MSTIDTVAAGVSQPRAGTPGRTRSDASPQTRVVPRGWWPRVRTGLRRAMAHGLDLDRKVPYY